MNYNDFKWPFLKVIIGMIIIGMMLSTALPAAAAADPMINSDEADGFVFYEPRRLTYDEHRSNYPNLLIDPKDNIHLIWSDSRNDPDHNDASIIYEIFYKKYNKNGKVVVNDTRLTNATTINQSSGFWVPGSTVALDSDGNIHMAYNDYTKHKYAGNRINTEIYYMKLDGGLNADGDAADRNDLVLIDEQRVSKADAHSGSVDLVVDSSDNVHIVWYDHRSFSWNWEIYYEQLAKDGTVIVDDKRLTTNLGYAAGPEIEVDSEDNLHVAFKSYHWTNDMNRIYYMKLDSDGDVLVSQKKITEEGVTTPTPYGKGYPLIVLDSEDNVHMTWSDNRDDTDLEVYYLKLDSDGDALMTDPVRVTDSGGDSRLQEFEIDSKDRIYVGYRDLAGSYHQMHLAVLDKDGDFIMEPYQVTVSESLSDTPSFAFDSHGSLNIAFVDTITWHPEIYLALARSLALELAFVPTGVKGGTADIKIYEDNVLIEEFTVTRTTGKPVKDAVLVTVDIDLDSSYTIEVEYTPPSDNGGKGALPLKIYVVENGEFAESLKSSVVNKKAGKGAKITASFDIDDFLAEYF